MAEVLRARPVRVQVKHRGVFVPPRYELFKQDVSVSIAGKLAEIFNLNSTQIVINQNSSSTQYLSFRYFLAGEPLRYFDGYIGIDQTEIIFSNPATMAELMGEISKVWSIVFENLKPTIGSNYVEATLHCETEGVSAKAFLNDFVKVRTDIPELHKGFSLTAKDSTETSARISVDVSDSVPDGLYVVFAYVSAGGVRDMVSLEKLFETVLTSYRRLQRLAHIELVEPT